MKYYQKPQLLTRLLPTLTFFLLFLVIGSSSVHAQAPANDDPCNAIPLTINPVCSFQVYTNANATATAGVPAPGCASYTGGDVWFSLVVPCTGSITIDTEQGVITDGGMAIYSGTCSNLTLITCDDDGSSNGAMPRITRSGLTPGVTIFVRVWEYGNNNNGTFGICVGQSAAGGGTGASSCSSAAPFCTSNVYNFPNTTGGISLGGSGTYGCLLTTPNPVWYYMQVATAGTIVIDISQTSSTGVGIDVDFALWGPFPSFASSCTGLSAANIVDCSYSPNATETAIISNAQVGEVYVMLLTNYSDDPGTITFQQSGGGSGGGGSTNCGIVCNIAAGNSGPVCPGSTFNLTATTVVGATYSWSGPNCFSSTSQNQTGLIAPTVPGSYVYTVSAVTPGGNNCTSTTTVVVGTSTTNASSTTTSTLCAGSATGSITVNHNSPGYTYTLNPGNITQSSPVFTGVAAGTYTVSFTNGAGCNGVVSPNPVVGSGPAVVVNATTIPTSCPSRADGTITVVPATAGTYTYTLNPGSITQSSPVFTNVPAGTYSVQITGAGGCTGTRTGIVVTPGPLPTSTFVKTNSVCANINSGSITITPSGPAPYNITLTGPGGPYTQTNTTFTNLAPGTYNYTFSNAAGCNGTGGPVVITTNPALATTVNLVKPLCFGTSNGSITMAASGGVAPYQYSINGGTFQGPVFSGLAIGTHTIRIRDAAGCTKDTTVQLTQPTLLTASATTVNATCNGNDGTITVSGSGGTPPYQYSIDNGANYQSNPVFIAPAVGPYSTIKVKDANGCIATTSATVDYTDNMTLSAGNDTTICEEQSIILQPITNAGTSVFRWSPATNLNNGAIKNPVASPTRTITYTLNASYGPCSRQDDVTITVLTKPVANAGTDVTICDRDSTLLVGSASNLSGTVNYLWTPKSGVQVDTAASTYTYPGVTQTFTLTVRDNYGCNFLVTDKVLVTVRPPVPANAGKDTIAVLGQPHQLRATGGSTYMWSPTTPLSSPVSSTPLATLRNDTRFTVVVTDIAGCLGYDTVFVKVYNGPTYYTPNAFSPNGDGLNDIFRAIPVGIKTTEYFRVFNRYGQMMFETNQWLMGWNGRYLGKLQPAGVYVWILKGIDNTGKTIEMKGTVMLVQ